MKVINKCPTSVPVLYHGTELLSSDQEKVKALNTFFSEYFNYSVPSLLPSHCEQTNECYEDLFCTVEEVCSMLKSLDVTLRERSTSGARVVHQVQWAR